MSYQAPQPVTPEDVSEALVPYREHGLPAQWWLLLGDEPTGLRDSLRAIGMESWGGATAMALPLADWTPSFHPSASDLECTRVASWEERMVPLRVVPAAFLVAPEP